MILRAKHKTRLGELLHTCRMHQGWTRRHAAWKLGVTVKTLENWEFGVAQPKLRHVTCVCSLYELSHSRFFEAVDSAPIGSRKMVGADIGLGA